MAVVCGRGCVLALLEPMALTKESGPTGEPLSARALRRGAGGADVSLSQALLATYFTAHPEELGQFVRSSDAVTELFFPDRKQIPAGARETGLQILARDQLPRNGWFGRRTEVLVKAFQAARGLDATGQIDQQTLLLLKQSLWPETPEPSLPASRRSGQPRIVQTFRERGREELASAEMRRPLDRGFKN